MCSYVSFAVMLSHHRRTRYLNIFGAKINIKIDILAIATSFLGFSLIFLLYRNNAPYIFIATEMVSNLHVTKNSTVSSGEFCGR